jgi:hypothetical protein
MLDNPLEVMMALGICDLNGRNPHPTSPLLKERGCSFLNDKTELIIQDHAVPLFIK